MEPIVLNDKIEIIFKEIFIAFLFSLAFITPFSYLLTRVSLKPMKDSIVIMDGFINGIVHDINTPLSVVKMNAQSIVKNTENQKLKEKSLRIIKGIGQIESLEEQLLFSLKIGQYKLQNEKFDIAKIINERRDYWNDIRPNIKVNVRAKILLVNADKIAMLRAIDNIVNNAIKYSPSKKEVDVILRDNKLEIIDNGIGIKKPKEVFGKYYRESVDTKGVGIGLYIVAQIVKLHSINIDVKSTINEGSRFCIDLKNIVTTA
ncbi:MAG: HAMP domain-containing sensor histidine kinase [Campylobacterota bacterium]|nr:HAMP domain-containing sensor histidine kinase [Campylobacterota bacterium]